MAHPSIEIIRLPRQFHREPRGWSFTPFLDPDRIREIAIDWTSFHTVAMEPGTVRGNHYHPKTREWLLFCGGTVLLVWQDPDTEEVRQARIEDHHTLVIIPPGVKHAIKNLSDGLLYLVAFRSPVSDSDREKALPAPLIKE